MSRDITTLRRLLRESDAAAVHQGIELASALGGEVVDGLLEGVTYDPHALPTIWPLQGRGQLGSPTEFRRVVGRLYPNEFFKGKDEERQIKWSFALAALVSRGQGPRATALREEMRSVVFGHYMNWSADVTWDVALLDGFSNLEELVLWVDAKVVNLGHLAARLPRLRRLRVRSGGRPVGLEGIAAANLDELEVDGGLDNLDALRGASLKRLMVSYEHLHDVRGIGAMPELEQLHLACAGNYAGIAGAPRLREVFLRGDGDAPSREGKGLDNLGALAQVRTLRCPTSSLVGLSSAPHLEALETLSLAGMPELPNLRKLTMNRLHETPPLPALEEVECYDIGLARWADLARWPRLRSVQLVDPKVNPVTTEGVPPLTLRWASWTRGIPGHLTLLSKVECLRDLANVEGITFLALEGCTRLTSLEGVSGMRSLRGLDLRGGTALRDLRAIAGLDLHVILTHGCPAEVPEEHRWAVVTDPEVIPKKLAGLLKRKRPN